MNKETLRQFLISPYSVGPWLALGFALGFAFQVTTIGVWIFLVALISAASLPWLANRLQWKKHESADAIPIPGLLVGWLAGFMIRGMAL